MHFLLIGATGRTGKAVLAESLQQGHTVTAMVRDPRKLEASPGVTVTQGSSLSSEDVLKAFDAEAGRPVDAVLVTLNISRESASPFAKVTSPANLMEHSIANVAAAMKQKGVRKLVVLTAFGTGDSYPHASWMIKALIHHTFLAEQMKDHDAAHQVVKNDDEIDWVFFRPARLTEEGKMPVKEHGDLGKGVSAFAKISIPSVAAAMVDAAADSRRRQTPVITN